MRRGRTAARSHLTNDAYLHRLNAAFEPSGGESVSTPLSPDDDCNSVTHDLNALTLSTPIASISTGWATRLDHTPSTLLDLSDRPLLCSSLHTASNTLTIGSSDHAVYTIDLEKKTLGRTLYTKEHGHYEWVTCVAHTDDGRVVSGGMDNKLCLWSRNALTCRDLSGHKGSVSGVCCYGQSIVSCSYDKSVKIWNSTNGREISTLDGHRSSAVLLTSSPSTFVATGDRGGSVFVWNIATAELRWRLKKIHKGHITAIQWQTSSANAESCTFLTGAQDGILRMWDMRDRSNVFKERIHGDVTSTAAINNIHLDNNHVITTGADKTLKICDLRDMSAVLSEIRLSCFPYTAAVDDGSLVCSCGDGSIYLVDLQSLKTMDRIVTNLAAMRFMHFCNGQLICGGDAGQLCFYDLHKTALSVV